MLKITIIGAGHGGLALAAHFTSHNAQVTLCAIEPHVGFSQHVAANNNTVILKDHVNKTVSANPSINYTKIYAVTNSYKIGLENSDIIFVVTPSFAHETIFRNILPYITSDHKILTLAGNFSSIVFNNILQTANIHTKCLLADISSLPYACRIDKTGYTVDVFGIKKQMGIAAIPAKRTLELKKLLDPLFPTKLIPYKNPLEIGLNITSGISHPISAIFNAGRIGIGKEEFYFYKDGISEHTSILLEQLDHDRQHIGSLYNLKLPKYIELMEEFYGNRYGTIHEFFTKTPIHNAQKLCPKSLSDRYISQDVPYVIVPWYALGKAMGFESVIMRNIIELSSMINQKDYMKLGIKQRKNNAHTFIN